jgi:hypothetical protein
MTDLVPSSQLNDKWAVEMYRLQRCKHQPTVAGTSYCAMGDLRDLASFGVLH